MRIGILGMGRMGLMHARNLAQTTGVDDVVLMGHNQARFAVSVEHVSAAIQPDPVDSHRLIPTSTDRPPTHWENPMSSKLMIAALPETTLRWVCDPVAEGAKTTAQKHEGSRATTDPISAGFGDDRATLILVDTAVLHSAAKHGSIDVGPDA
jgi:hypothetical protein